MHIIWICPFATNLWSRVSTVKNLQLVPWSSFRCWAAVVFDGRDVEQVELIFCYAWRLWYAQNVRVWQQEQVGLELCNAKLRPC